MFPSAVKGNWLAFNPENEILAPNLACNHGHSFDEDSRYSARSTSEYHEPPRELFRKILSLSRIDVAATKLCSRRCECLSRLHSVDYFARVFLAVVRIITGKTVLNVCYFHA